MTRSEATPLVLLTAAFMIVLGLSAATGASAADGCDLERSQQMVVGDAGFVGADGVSRAEESIPTECQGEAFALNGTTPGDDLDIDFYAANGTHLDEHTNGPGDEAGFIPEDAVRANITYWSGVAGGYTLQASESLSNPVEAPVDLYLHSGPSGVGIADSLLGESTMDQTPPTGGTPSVWNSAWLVAGVSPTSPYDAHWQWSPGGGYDLDNVTLDVTFWASDPPTGSWEVAAFSDGELATTATAEDLSATDEQPRKYEATLGPISIQGGNLTIQINPAYLFDDGVHEIFYDSMEFPSGVEIEQTNPLPDPVPNLTVEETGAGHVSLDWEEASAPLGVSHYRVYRGQDTSSMSVVGEPEDTAFLDTTADAGTDYVYNVTTVSLDGTEGPPRTVAASTDGADSTAPTISGTSVDTGATALRVHWSTDEVATGKLVVGDTQDPIATVSVPFGTEHAATVSDLAPNATYDVTIEAEDTSGNVATQTLQATTTENQTLFLHIDENQNRWMNAFDDPGDATGFDYNDLAPVLETSGVQSVVDAYPVDEPDVPSLQLNTSENVTGTIYVRDVHESPQDHPNGTEIETEQGPSHLEVNLSVYANGELLGGQTVSTTQFSNQGWIPLDYEFSPLTEAIERGTLRAEVRLEAGTSGYEIGYEGDHASRITLPIQPELPFQAEIEKNLTQVVTGTEVGFEAQTLGGAGNASFTWDFGDGTTATGSTVSHIYDTVGEQTVTLTVEDEQGRTVEQTTSFRVHQGDFVDEARTVVAVIDSGVNPYHEIYQRPGIELPLDEFGNPQTIELSEEAGYDKRVRDYRYDRHAWQGLEEGELVHFEGTNVLGVSFAGGNDRGRILDADGHGTWTSSTVLKANPDATIVLVQATQGGTDLANAVEWASKQPWIDQLSISWGQYGNAPVGPGIVEHTKRAADRGKVVVASAGNDPSPLPTDLVDGPPWVLSITGSQSDGDEKEILSSNVYPDFVSDYTVQAAAHESTGDDEVTVSGTSFSAPRASGTISAIVQNVREARGHTGGITEGNLVPAAGPADPAVDRHDVRDVLNRTAILPSRAGLGPAPGALTGHAHTPVAPYATAQWGQVDPRIVPDATADVLNSNLDVPTTKLDVWAYKQSTHETRVQFWQG